MSLKGSSPTNKKFSTSSFPWTGRNIELRPDYKHSLH
jgi:hypothetical protein